MLFFLAKLGVCDWWRGTQIDPVNIEAIIKCITLTNVTKVRNFMGETQYL